MPVEVVSLWLQWLTMSLYHLDVLRAPGSRPVCRMHLDVPSGGPGSEEASSGAGCHQSGEIQLEDDQHISQSLEFFTWTIHVSARWETKGLRYSGKADRRYSRVVSTYPVRRLLGTEEVLERTPRLVLPRQECSQTSVSQRVGSQYCCLTLERSATGRTSSQKYRLEIQSMAGGQAYCD